MMNKIKILILLSASFASGTFAQDQQRDKTGGYRQNMYPSFLNAGIDNDAYDGQIGLRINAADVLEGVLGPTVRVGGCYVNATPKNPEGVSCTRNATLQFQKDPQGNQHLNAQLVSRVYPDVCEGEETIHGKLNRYGIEKYSEISVLLYSQRILNRACLALGGHGEAYQTLNRTNQVRVRGLGTGPLALVPMPRRCHTLDLSVTCDLSSRKADVIQVSENFLNAYPEHPAAATIKDILASLRNL